MLAISIEVDHVVRADRGCDVRREAFNDLVGYVVLGGLPTDTHHAGYPVNMVRNVLTGHLFGDSQTVAVRKESDEEFRLLIHPRRSACHACTLTRIHGGETVNRLQHCTCRATNQKLRCRAQPLME